MTRSGLQASQLETSFRTRIALYAFPIGPYTRSKTYSPCIPLDEIRIAGTDCSIPKLLYRSHLK
jgi:hypothetical protein